MDSLSLIIVLTIVVILATCFCMYGVYSGRRRTCCPPDCLCRCASKSGRVCKCKPCRCGSFRSYPCEREN